MLTKPGPWGTGPYQLTDGFSTAQKRADRIVLEANKRYWDPERVPKLQRLVFDNTLSHQRSRGVGQERRRAGRPGQRATPWEAMSVAQSPHAKLLSKHGGLVTVFGQFNMRKRQAPGTMSACARR